VNKPGAPQSYILGGHLVPGLGTDRDLARAAMNDVLGGSFTSRVNMNLLEDKGWSYGADTVLQSAAGPRPFLIVAAVETARTGDSLVELVRELEAIGSTRPVAEAEMSRVVAGATRSLPGSYETVSAVLSSLMTSARYGRPLDYAATLAERYEALGLEDLREAALDVHPESVVWMIVGDLAAIRSQVAAVGLAPVEIWNDDGEPLE
jgi:zinc protease